MRLEAFCFLPQTLVKLQGDEVKGCVIKTEIFTEKSRKKLGEKEVKKCLSKKLGSD